MESRKRPWPGGEDEDEGASPKGEGGDSVLSSSETDEGDRKLAAVSTSAAPSAAEDPLQASTSASGGDGGEDANTGGISNLSGDGGPSVAVAAAVASASNGDDNDDESEGSAKKRMRTAEAAGQNRVSHEDRWVEMFNRLLAYKEQHGRFVCVCVLCKLSFLISGPLTHYSYYTAYHLSLFLLCQAIAECQIVVSAGSPGWFRVEQETNF